jgi:hypothetical protein
MNVLMKTIGCAVLLVCMGTAAFSQEQANPAPETVSPGKPEGVPQPDGAYGEAHTLLKEGLNRNFDAITGLAGFLTEAERIALYQEFVFPQWKRIAGIPVSFAAGYGIGNFIQGDTTWGGISLAAGIVGSTIMYAGMALFSVTLVTLPLLAVAGTFSEAFTVSNYLLFGGLGLVLGNNIASGIRSMMYPKIYDHQLRRALKLENATLDRDPALVFSGGGPGLALVQFRF